MTRRQLSTQAAVLLGIIGAVALVAWAVDQYPTEAWPTDADVQLLGGTTDQATGAPYIAPGTNANSSPPLAIQVQRQVQRIYRILALANELRVVEEATALRIGVFPGNYQMNGTRTRFEGATGQGNGSLTLGDDTYYVYIDNANALQIVTDAAGWPADESQFVPLAEVTVADGAITGITDRRGWAHVVIPQSGGAGIDGTDEAFFILDQDNGGAGVSQDYRFNRGSTGADAGLRWNETTDLVEVLSDVTGPTYGNLKALGLQSTVTTGTAPLTVASATKVTNLNADAVDGMGFDDVAGATGALPYASETTVMSWTAGPSVADVLIADGSGVPSWEALGSDSGVQAYDADLTAIAAVTDTGLLARTGAGTAAARVLTAGASISVADGDGVAGDPTIAVSGATQYAVQVGSAAGALNSVAVGSSNTVLCGNTGANPGFRQLLNADISDSAAITPAKLNKAIMAGDVYFNGNELELLSVIRARIPYRTVFTVGSEGADTIRITIQPESYGGSYAITLIDLWLSDTAQDDGTMSLTGTAATSLSIVSDHGAILQTVTTGKYWKLITDDTGTIEVDLEYTGGAKTWYLASCYAGVVSSVQVVFAP